MEQIFVLKVFE